MNKIIEHLENLQVSYSNLIEENKKLLAENQSLLLKLKQRKK